jgi:DNA-binding transcriptional regulator YiaG
MRLCDDAMSDFRELRRSAGFSQAQFAALVGISLESCRAWDSGRRPVPTATLAQARTAVAEHAKLNELLSLRQMAAELGVHVSTLQLAARTGRLRMQFHTRSVFGRPMCRVTRAAGKEFMRAGYWQRAERLGCTPPLVSVPNDYDERLRRLRRRLRLSQAGLAKRIGAAGKAVVYQWESRKRAPSPVFWRVIESLSPRRPAIVENTKEIAQDSERP